MQRRKYVILIVVVLTLLPAGLAAGSLSQSTDELTLVQIPLGSADQLAQVQAAAWPVYAQLTGLEGDYLLAGASSSQLRGSTWPVKVLAEEVGEDLYLATAAGGQVRPEWSAYGQVLLDDGFQVLLQLGDQELEALAAAGAELAALDLEPIALSGRAPAVLPSAAGYDPAVEAMIGQVISSTLYAYEEKLTGQRQALVGGSYYTIATRHTSSGEPIQKATQWAFEHLEGLGLPVEYHEWTAGSYSGRNVIAEIQGQLHPEQIVIVCAHLDDMPYGAIAPGADDNGSGSAGVLLAADILSQYQWPYTIQFILWTGEEQGLLGSNVWAEWADNQGIDIRGVLNLDMVAYNSDAFPIVDLHARSALPDSVALANLFVSVVDVYDIDLTPHILIDNWLGNYSDNKSFWDEGYAAILAIEDEDDFTPYYHTVNDTLTSLNMFYFTDMIKAAVGAMAHLAQGEITQVYLPLCWR